MLRNLCNYDNWIFRFASTSPPKKVLQKYPPPSPPPPGEFSPLLLRKFPVEKFSPLFCDWKIFLLMISRICGEGGGGGGVTLQWINGIGGVGYCRVEWSCVFLKSCNSKKLFNFGHAYMWRPCIAVFKNLRDFNIYLLQNICQKENP